MILICPRCEHNWNYRGTLTNATCPSCGKKVKVEESSGAGLGSIKIGLIHSEQGDMAWTEDLMVEGAMMAVEEINSRGGLMGATLEFLREDGESNPEIFAEKANILIDNDVVSLFGTWRSDCRIRVGDVVRERENLLWYPAQYEGYEANPNVIYTGLTPSQQIIPSLEWCILANENERGLYETKDPDKSRWNNIFLIGSDYIFPWAANAIARSVLVEHDVKCAGEVYVPLGSMLEFGKIIEHIYEKTDADGIFSTLNGDSQIAFYRGLKEIGSKYDKKLPVMAMSIAENGIRKIHPDYLTGQSGAGQYCSWTYMAPRPSDDERPMDAASPDSHADELAFKFKEIYRGTLSDPILTSYQSVLLFEGAFLKAAEKKAALDVTPLDIRDAARGISLETADTLMPMRIEGASLHCWRTPRIGKVGDKGYFDVVWDGGGLYPPNPFPRRLSPEYPDVGKNYADKPNADKPDNDCYFQSAYRINMLRSTEWDWAGYKR